MNPRVLAGEVVSEVNANPEMTRLSRVYINNLIYY